MEPVQQTSVYHFPVCIRDKKMSIHGVWTKCSERERSIAYSIIANINSTTTPDQFDSLCNRLPSYKLHHWYVNTAFEKALHHSNIKLIEHILKINSLKNLKNPREDIRNIELGDERVTLLTICVTFKYFSSTINEIEKNQARYDAAKLLLFYGANVNMAVAGNAPRSSIPFSTPLQMAAEDPKKNYALIRLFLFNGGIIHNPLSEQGQKNVDNAIQQFYEQVKGWFWPSVQDEKVPFNLLNKDIRVLIYQKYFKLLYDPFASKS